MPFWLTSLVSEKADRSSGISIQSVFDIQTRIKKKKEAKRWHEQEPGAHLSMANLIFSGENCNQMHALSGLYNRLVISDNSLAGSTLHITSHHITRWKKYAPKLETSFKNIICLTGSGLWLKSRLCQMRCDFFYQKTIKFICANQTKNIFDL